MQVILSAGLVVFPGLSPEGGLPVVGPVFPDVPIPLRVIPAEIPVPFRIVPTGAGFPEPGVPVGGVVHHHVHDYPQPAPVRFCHQPVEVGQAPIARVDIAVIAHVVAEIDIRAGIDRGKPDGIHAQVGQVVEPGDDPGQVAQSVPVGIRERTRINLVNDPVAPPQIVVHATSFAGFYSF